MPCSSAWHAVIRRKPCYSSGTLYVGIARLAARGCSGTERLAGAQVHTLVKLDELMLERIKYFLNDVEREEWKLDMLCDLYDTLEMIQCAIFVNT